MSLEQQRTIEAQQRQIHKLNRELSEMRQVIIDAHGILDNMAQHRGKTALVFVKLRDFLKGRGLL